MITGPAGRLLIIFVFGLVYLGWAVRVLDRMRLSARTALLLLTLIFAGSFLPELPLGRFLALDLGGAIVPAGVAIYLLVTADTRVEKIRSGLAALVVGGVIYLLDKMLPVDLWYMRLDPDPLLLPILLAAVLAYLVGRTRRGAFIAGVLGVILTDLLAAIENAVRGLPSVIAIGGAGILDATVLAGFGAVALVEAVGETREYLARRRGGAAVVARGAMVVLAALLLWRWGGLPADGRGEVRGGQPFQLVCEDGNVLAITSRMISPGDSFISPENLVYEVVSVEKRMARARLAGDVSDLVPALPIARTGLTSPGIFERFVRQDDPETEEDETAGPNLLVAIYHTHSAESYVPSDGADSILGRGGVHGVGSQLARELRGLGIPVSHSENLHLPHDIGAYRRSRRTAIQLIGQGPEIMIDLHRDAAPMQTYATQVDDVWMTQVMFVIGTYNPTFGANRRFAIELKDLADRRFPGLIRGILVTGGNFNQDLGPRTILIEVGAHMNTREAAERAMKPFAEVLARYLRGER